MLALLEDVDAVVHMGGVSTEQPWESILAGNIVGMVNLYEAARKNKASSASSSPAATMSPAFTARTRSSSPHDPVRPDGFYGLSKAFGENLAQLYWDRHGIETVSLRIGSSFTEPKDRRMLATWMSYDDTERLIVAALTAPIVGHSIIYGMSDNETDLVGQHARPPHRLPAAGQLGRLPRRSRGAPADHRRHRPGGDLPGRRLRALRVITADRNPFPTFTPCADSRRDTPGAHDNSGHREIPIGRKLNPTGAALTISQPEHAAKP